MAPMPGPGQKAAPLGAMGLGMNKIEKEEDKTDKFQKVMDWGTPRLVTKNRAIVMDQKTMQQRAFLHNIASVRKGLVADV